MEITIRFLGQLFTGKLFKASKLFDSHLANQRSTFVEEGGFKPWKKMIKNEKSLKKDGRKKIFSRVILALFSTSFHFLNLFPRLKSSLVDGIGWESHYMWFNDETTEHLNCPRSLVL